MKLDLQGIRDKEVWQAKGYQLPQYDIGEMKKATMERPFWIHFGAGNLFRAFHACAVEDMLNSGALDRGLIVAGGYEIVEQMYAPHDNLGIAVTLKADGSIEKKVVASVAEALPLDASNEQAYGRLREIFAKDSLQMATFTITEKGYRLTDGRGKLLSDVEADFAAGPQQPVSYMGQITSLLYTRFLAGEKPIAMVSTDNCSHNGDKLLEALQSFAQAWSANGKVQKEFEDYLCSGRVAFTWSMIDKITPRPDASIEKILREDQIEGLEPVITSRNSYIAPFVNAEETGYLVIEDDFPNGRPDLTRGGLMFADRGTVDRVEKMKVCTCLNPLHTCLAIFGCLLGYERICDEMKDPQLRRLVEIVGYVEGLPVVADPGILDPEKFIDTVLNVRFPNPFMPDTPQRIATDTSQKLAIRFGETIKAYAADPKRSTDDLKMIPLVFAGWLRYLMGIDDRGEQFALSPDPMLDQLCPYAADIALGSTDVEEKIRPILANSEIFGVDLYEIHMAERVTAYFKELIEGEGAVRAALEKYV